MATSPDCQARPDRSGGNPSLSLSVEQVENRDAGDLAAGPSGGRAGNVGLERMPCDVGDGPAPHRGVDIFKQLARRGRAARVQLGLHTIKMRK